MPNIFKIINKHKNKILSLNKNAKTNLLGATHEIVHIDIDGFSFDFEADGLLAIYHKIVDKEATIESDINKICYELGLLYDDITEYLAEHEYLCYDDYSLS